MTPVLDSFLLAGNLCLVKPYYKFNLVELKQNVNLSKQQLKKISYCILGLLNDAHRLDIHHLNLKPQNILFDKDLTPKITDWCYDR